MADEVRQKFEALAQDKGMIVLRYSGERFKIDYLNGDTNRAWEWFQEGKRAGEIAQLEALLDELVGSELVLHSDDGDISYSAIGDWLRRKRAAPEQVKP